MRVEILRVLNLFFFMLETMSKTERKAFYLVIINGYIWVPAGRMNCATFPLPYIYYGNILLGGTVRVKTWATDVKFCLWFFWVGVFFEHNHVLKGSPMQRRLHRLAHCGYTLFLKHFGAILIHLAFYIFK